MNSPIGQPQTLSPDEAALNFARAHYQWRRLSADQEQWTDPARQRELAAAFLRYHSAKLALIWQEMPDTRLSSEGQALQD